MSDLPTDFDEFYTEYREWLDERIEQGNLVATANPFPGRNFMADVVLGCYQAGRWVVEISTSYFLDRRFIGLTVATTDDLGNRSAPTAHSFEELDQVIADLVFQPLP